MFAAANLGNAAKGFAEFRVICNSLYEYGIHAFARFGGGRESFG
jgi:hypothetical protein